MFSARDVGHALQLVSRGETYRQAAALTREMAERELDAVQTYVRSVNGKPVARVRHANLDGQLVANWVDVFAPVVTFDALPAVWPERLAVDSKEFRVGGVQGRSFHIFVALGYDPPAYRERVWLMRPFPTKDQAAWEEFFELLLGTPSRIMSDMDNAIAGAVAAVFPRAGRPAPDHRWSEFHIKRALTGALAPLAGQSHPIWDALDVALLNHGNWAAFEAAIQHEDAQGTPLPAAMRWLRQSGPRVAQQAATRPHDGPHSTSPVEAVIQTLSTRLLGERVRSFGNRARMTRLLDLLTLGLNRKANERAFAKKVRLHLEAHAWQASHQRPHDDPRGQPSLFV